MALSEQFEKAKIGDEELNQLESDLIDFENEVNVQPAFRGGSNSQTNVFEEENATKIRREIMGVYRDGIDIGSAVTVYPLIELLNSGGQPVPPHLLVTSKTADVYLLQFTFIIRLVDGILPETAEFAVDLFNGDGINDMPVVISFFPQETHETLIKVTSQAKVGLTGNLNFAVPMEVAAATGLAEASAKIEVSSSFIVGPFNFELRKAKIMADGINQSRVQWKYLLSSDLAGSSEFQSWVVVKVPKDLKTLKIKANLGVLPFKRAWSLFKTHLLPLYGSIEREIRL